MKFIDLLDEYLIARDNFAVFNQGKYIPSKEYQEAGQFLFQTIQQKREALAKSLGQVEEVVKYLNDESDDSK